MCGGERLNVGLIGNRHPALHQEEVVFIQGTGGGLLQIGAVGTCCQHLVQQVVPAGQGFTLGQQVFDGILGFIEHLLKTRQRNLAHMGALDRQQPFAWLHL